MATIDIYLPIESTTEWIHALSIPRRDIERLTIRPLKWLRFATFTVCGAKGHLSTTKGGQTVDYQNVSFDNLADRYYFTPDNNVYHLVDYQAFNDKCTTTAATPRSSNFRENVCARDGECVITGTECDDCDAAHIIPRSKGHEYISFVVRDRSSLYEQLPFSLEEDIDINCIQNGILLRADLHRKFGKAKIVFLKTPNFAMEPGDVPRVEQYPMPGNRTTLQYMVPITGLDTVPPRDVQVDWRDEVHPPPSGILLDFMYGAAVVKHWKCDSLRDMLERRFKDTFKTILAKIPERSAPKDDELEGEPDDPKDLTWEPPGGKQKGRKTFSSDASAGLLEAMDDVLLLSMLLKGTAPQSIAAERERRHKEEELRSQEKSREKVQQWLNLSRQSQVAL
ncbi:hypothetical protein L210DRAFT_3411547 [Boletus edulis BED1]|uniref:HNH nuclease domain-containing protein n=1 Tax=Boletus edulis BED1 TaxID=1328754 RepID=A0AAD4BLD3_BOLED|nr:hypothetical protein L210DRAFT_3411547 [Boletus edulis BED1]